MKSPRWYEVWGMEHGGYSNGLEPPDTWREYAFVFTTTRARARKLAVRWWRRMTRTGRSRYETVTCGENPFADMKVSEVTATCEKCGRLWVLHSDAQFNRCVPEEDVF